MKRTQLIVVSGAALLAAGCGEQSNAPREDVAALPAGEYVEFTVKDPQQSAAFMAVEDLNNDGVKEIVLSTLLEVTPPGPPGALSRGALRVFSTQQGLAGPWDEQVVVEPSLLDGYPFINTPQVMDINGDGVKDILVQTGFLSTFGGTQFWLEGPDFSQRHYFSDETRWSASNFFWHESAQLDLDGDGLLDIVTTSAQTQDLLSNPMGSPDGNELLKVEWYRQLDNGEFEYHKLLDDVGGVFLKMHDVDADGDQDILLTHFFGYPQRPSVVWMEQLAAPSEANDYAGEWATHPIDSTIGLGYHMEIADMDLDGEVELVVGSHNHQDDPRMVTDDGDVILPGMYIYEFPDNPRELTQWPYQVVSQDFRITLAGSTSSQGTPGIFSIGDVDGNGWPDIVVPGDGNDKMWVLRQSADGQFVLETVVEGEKMIAMAVITDVDGDGSDEIVAAKHNSNDGGYTLPPGFLKIYKFQATTQ